MNVTTTRRLLAAAREAETASAELVVAVRRQGHTWQEIADVLGVSRQQAHRRYSPLCDD